MITFSIATILLWQLPFGNYILYPLTILGTWFHEMGHGITSIILGGTFHKLEIYSDGSGVATHSGTGLGFLGLGLTALGGPLAPAFAGSFLIISAKNQKYSKIVLILTSLLMIISSIIFIRTLFGIISLILLGSIVLYIALRFKNSISQYTSIFIGLQAFISNYQSIGYFFTKNINKNGFPSLSDSGVMEANLFLPYWFWGGGIILISIILLVYSIKYLIKD